MLLNKISKLKVVIFRYSVLAPPSPNYLLPGASGRIAYNLYIRCRVRLDWFKSISFFVNLISLYFFHFL